MGSVRIGLIANKALSGGLPLQTKVLTLAAVICWSAGRPVTRAAVTGPLCCAMRPTDVRAITSSVVD